MVAALGAGGTPSAHAQFGGIGGLGFNRGVGGVSIDPNGVLEAPSQQDEQQLAAARAKVQVGAPQYFQKFEDLRAV